jgi:hypothetical protein
MAPRYLTVINADIGIAPTPYQKSLAKSEPKGCGEAIAHHLESQVAWVGSGCDGPRGRGLLISILNDSSSVSGGYVFFSHVQLVRLDVAKASGPRTQPQYPIVVGTRGQIRRFRDALDAPEKIAVARA